MNVRRFATIAAVTLSSFALPMSAGATVKREGNWPAAEKKVDLEFDGPPSEALKELAHEAGWSLVVQDGAGIDHAGRDVHVNVDDQPADSILDALFVGRDITARRSGSLVTIVGANTPAAAETATPAPLPTTRGKDREIVGSNLVVQANETVHDVTVTGGSAVVKGTITGDLVVTGGSAKLEGSAHVVGDASVLGGTMHLAKGARVDGDATVTGGSLEREEGSIIGGDAIAHGDSDEDSSADEDEHEREPSKLARAASRIGRSLTRASLLFVLGCVLLALLAPQMERLRVEVAARPMRSFAIGLVTALAGSIALAVSLTLLCLTVIGIPVALGIAVALVFALYGSVASVLTTLGAAVAGHRTSNPYLHLLAGCGVFLVVTCIPWIGGLAIAAVMAIALGALITTRGGGIFERRRYALPV